METETTSLVDASQEASKEGYKGWMYLQHPIVRTLHLLVVHQADLWVVLVDSKVDKNVWRRNGGERRPCNWDVGCWEMRILREHPNTDGWCMGTLAVMYCEQSLPQC